jgi:hypothetical protein
MVMRGERPPKGDAWKRAVIGRAADQGDALNLSCATCRRFVQYSAAEFMTRHRIPRNTPYYSLVQRLKCASCGSREVSLQIAPVNAPGFAKG